MYHFRDMLGTKIEIQPHVAPVTIPDALHLAYMASSQLDKAVYVCKDSDTNGHTGYTEFASVKCLP